MMNLNLYVHKTCMYIKFEMLKSTDYSSNRENYMKFCFLSGDRAKVNTTIVGLYDSLTDGKSQTGTALLMSYKGLENILLIAGRNTRAGVLYTEINILPIAA